MAIAPPELTVTVKIDDKSIERELARSQAKIEAITKEGEAKTNAALEKLRKVNEERESKRKETQQERQRERESQKAQKDYERTVAQSERWAQQDMRRMQLQADKRQAQEDAINSRYFNKQLVAKKEHEAKKLRIVEIEAIKQQQALDRYNQKQIQAAERAHLRMVNNTQTWSERMTKSLDSVAMSVKGFAIAWGTAQVASMVKGSLELAGGMRDLASGVGLSTQQYFALTSALRDAGVQAEKIDPMFTRLNDLISGGASEKQATILSRLGIDATGMSNVQLMDTLLEKINARLITQSDLGELVGTRIVPAWNRLANEINNVNDANSRYKFPLTDKEVDRLDRVAQKWAHAKDMASLYFAGIYGDLLRLANQIENVDPIPMLPGVAASYGWANNMGRIQRGAEFGPNLPPSATPRGGDGASLPPVRARRSSYGLGAGDDAVLGRSYSVFNTLAPVSGGVSPIRGMAQDLPTVTRELENSANFAERVAESVSSFADSNTWQVAQAGAQAFGSIMSMQSQLIQNEIDGLNVLMQMEEQRWQDKVRMAEASGTATSAAFRNEAREHERIEKQRQKKIRELQAKSFETNKTGGIASTVMNTAEGIMRAFTEKEVPFPIKLILAGMVAAQGAAQVAMISSQKNPYRGYAFGGYVPGQSLGDDTMINVTGGEFVSTREATRNNRAALEYANKGGILRPNGDGGITVIIQGDIVGDDAYVENRLIPRLQKAIDRGYRLRVA